ncbi:arabinogalactan oligomer / maltooligosaccharide transport system permease protein [Ruminococcus sp. YE71]|uniref:carbohydrate ABC transporter permease n=1 Tax=unclassified Ruminococcus TaxID=2608920 RepID=UPI000881FE94|nr:MULTISPECIES: sugar ABC transporter permease [unclassified Ruminococcus]SDA12133.1 arabinogalactan oligomer / maltooligosaccharide transport system permease protein [Ruminococcus sp. YE78]SFW16378.1 arabinogalactan oligomer / maltooligosaccharide transport system permease protein [Ruminococcus sp. YE71]
MKRLPELEYLGLPPAQQKLYDVRLFFAELPKKLLCGLKKIPSGIGRFFAAVGRFFSDLGSMFVNGDVKTKLSFFIMGFGQFFRRQTGRGIIFLIMEALFVWFMAGFGLGYLSDMSTLGTVAVEKTLNDYGLEITVYKDNSLKILLYGVLTIFIILGFLWTWYTNVKQNYTAQELIAEGIRPKSFKDDLKSIADEQYYKTLLAVPLLGITVFTVIPIFFMILIAFTNYDYSHLPPEKLFSWVGFENFRTILSTDVSGGSKFAFTFREILIWTMIWALVATFSNYFLGMFVAICINKKGIRFKKGFRTILVMTIAVPQFVSLLLVSKMFADEGIVNSMLMDLGWISSKIGFMTTPTLAKIMVLIINLWIGIPYLMLITTGVLMNIPSDLYESARIDGASGMKQFTKITLPYMLFVTGPYLLTSFTANINNFNVIYLLTAGAPKTMSYEGGAGQTDLLITWLYTLTMTNNDYKMAAVIGILVFVVVAVISLIVYNLSPAMKNEEDFQ